MNKCRENKPGYANNRKDEDEGYRACRNKRNERLVMLQPRGEILNKPIGWLTTHATLSNNPANHRAQY